MNAFRIADFQRSPLKFEVPPGKSLQLKAGETVQAKVLGSPGSGVVTLKINDTIVTLKTEIPLPKDSEVYFKVVGSDAGKPNAELKLQFAGYAQPQPAPAAQQAPANLGIEQLLTQASKLLANKQDWAERLPEVIRQILKALPQDTRQIPRETRIELLHMLKSSLKLTGQNIQENVGKLLQQLPEEAEAGAQTGKALKELMVHIQKLTHSSLKNALENSGVALETKIKSFLSTQNSAQSPKAIPEPNAPLQQPSTAPSDPTIETSPSVIGDSRSQPPSTARADPTGAPLLPEGGGVQDKAGSLLQGISEMISELDSELIGLKTAAQQPAKALEQVGSDPKAWVGAKTAGQEPSSQPVSPCDLEQVPGKESIPQDPAGRAAASASQRRVPLPYRTAFKGELPQAEPPGTESTEVESSLASRPSPEGGERQGPVSMAGPEVETSKPFEKDLKALLTQLRSLLDEGGPEALDKLLGQNADSTKGAGSEKLSMKELAATIDGLLREVETFQLLSKVTDSFCTFLPIVWEELKEGDIAFKKPRGTGNEETYYCIVNLNLERFGGLMIMVLMQKKEFFVSFKTGSDALSSLLKQQTRELQLMFEESGINLKGVSVLRNEDTSLAPFENLEAFDSIINIKV